MPVSHPDRIGLRQKIESQHLRLENGDSVNFIEIANLIFVYLRTMQHSLGSWEKLHFANAISALAACASLRYQPGAAWLQVCLVNLEMVLMPECQRQNFHLKDDAASFTYEQLKQAVEAICA